MIAETPRYYAALGIVRFWQPALIGLAVLAAFLWGRCDRPEPVTQIVADTVMVSQPIAKPTIKERIVYRQVPVERVIIAHRVDTLRVREFVEAATRPDSLPPQHLSYSIEYDGDRLRMWGTMSDGDLTLHEFNVKPTFRAGWEADSAWAREQRLARLPKWKIAGGVAVVAGVVACLALCR